MNRSSDPRNSVNTVCTDDRAFFIEVSIPSLADARFGVCQQKNEQFFAHTTRVWLMQRRQYLSLAVGGAAAISGCGGLYRAPTTAPNTSPSRPNLIFVLTDDMGYGDPGCFGSPPPHTPNIDQMAAEGVKLTSWYGAPVCVPSRTALLTGRYPRRVRFEPGGVGPGGTGGLHPAESTAADVLSDAGYATACIGKWHLGHQPRERYLPMNQGFDYYYGIPYSNSYSPEWKAKYPPLPLIRGTETIEQSIDQDTMTRDFTDEAIAFARRHARRDGNEPFFIYLAHPMPHAPWHTTERFEGVSKLGRYGDVIRSLDFHTGRLLDALDELGVAEDTLTMFSSDNGPWGPGPGSNGPFRGLKGTVLEGGVREPTIAHWPGQIPAGTTCSTLTSAMDLLPTAARLAGTSMPPNRIIDGHDISPLLRRSTSAATSYDEFAYTRLGDWRFSALRRGRWKLHVNYPDDEPLVTQALYDLRHDPAEQHDRSDDHPDLVTDFRARIVRLNRRLAGPPAHPE